MSTDRLGYIRRWLVTNLAETSFTGAGGSDDDLRRQAEDPAIKPPDADAALNVAGPFGEPWRYYDAGKNVFLERSGFWHNLTHLDLYAVCDLETDAAVTIPVRLWTCGTSDVWLNGAHLCRTSVPLYMYPRFSETDLPLRAGRNRVAVRLQALGLRDTRVLFGLQLLGDASSVAVRLPGDPESVARLLAADEWLDGVRVAAPDRLTSAVAAPVDAVVRSGGESGVWRAGESAYRIAPAFAVEVEVECEGGKIARTLEIPGNRPAPAPPGGDVAAHRRSALARIAEGHGGSRDGVMNVLARRLLGQDPTESDARAIAVGLADIDGRKDCADFTLAMLLRLYALNLATPDEAARIKESALAFRYWEDEPGCDAMCFGSENHSLLFHSAQWITGRLFPDEVFANSGRTGREQEEIARERCRKWLEDKAANGFVEYLSGTYMPITVAALMNLVDFSDDAETAAAAAGVVDTILRQLALHCFDGVTVGPQGRVYRGILYPHTSGGQALLSYCTSRVVPAASDWTVFLASSPGYLPPADIDEIVAAPVCRRYRQQAVEIVLEKTAGYMLSSLRIPASFGLATLPPELRLGGARATDRLHHPDLQPGKAGYQQHLWHATLGRDCHVFINHPGCTFDMSNARPGYWYGNGSLPHLEQEEGMVRAIYDIAPSHPIPFTHAHWPTDRFEREERRDGWIFGAHGGGFVGLWCSESLTPHDEILTGRELRATGHRAAWICRVGEGADFDGFVDSCLGLRPAFDPETRTLTLATHPPMPFEP